MLEPISVYFEECGENWFVTETIASSHILLMMTHGEIIYTLNRETFHLKKNDVLFIPKGIIRKAKSITPHTWNVVHFQYQGEGEALPLLQKDEAFLVHFHQNEYLKQRFSLLIQHWLRKPKFASTMHHSILLEILTIINEEKETGRAYDKASVLAAQIQDYIVHHYRENVTLEELAELVDRTPNYISSVFKKTTGQSISAYKQQIKILAACDLLSKSQMNVGEVSSYLGFCEQSYFNKIFKKVTGTLPSTYLEERIRVWR
ncbi:AraC family transcriptional regulator [Jeotgalibaca caeni]|uniref:AraC family transcriptional regulator n=1 Tax=Jeotgalibaca caeni TaxID=3028623 RepID=UPI00237E4F96|nr:AraC family transcriptional regulator [Jeotgalibaca caeni]MDE1549815.1 AraC family transcriptional regulator [Jeotgalibaca caeni]